MLALTARPPDAKLGATMAEGKRKFWSVVSPLPAGVITGQAQMLEAAGIEQYEEFFAAHGFREEAKCLQEGVKRKDYLGVAHLVPDEMAQTFVVCGSADEVRKRIEPAWEVVDSLTLAPPVYGLETPKVLAYAGAIAQTFYGT